MSGAGRAAPASRLRGADGQYQSPSGRSGPDDMRARAALAHPATVRAIAAQVGMLDGHPVREWDGTTLAPFGCCSAATYREALAWRARSKVRGAAGAGEDAA